MENNPTVNKDDPNPSADAAGGSEEPTSKPGSEQPEKNQPDATRKLQSERDRYRSENEKMSERLERLETSVLGKQVEDTFKGFLEDNKDKYPDVDTDDLRARAEGWETEHLEAAAKAAQAKADRIRNDALQRMKEVPEESLSPEEERKALEKLAKDKPTPGQSKFGSFLDLRRKRKE